MTKKTGSVDKGKVDFRTIMESGQGFSGFATPEICGEFDFVVKKDGTWLYQGTPIGRKKLVQLFATVLQKDDMGYWLITPTEKGKITVEDAPFFMVEMSVEKSEQNIQVLKFRSTLDWWITAGKNNKIWVEIDSETQQPNPYIMVRDGLHARINRNTFYALCEIAQEYILDDGRTELIVQSNGLHFSLGIL